MKVTDEIIREGLSKTVPSDTYSKIEKAIDSATHTNNTEVIYMKKKNNVIKILLPAVAVFALVLTGLFGFKYYNTNVATDSVIDIDVNPGIELFTNKKDKVIDVQAINDEAIEILDGMKLKSTDLKVAVNAIVGSMVQKGYVKDDMSGILISVKNKDSNKADSLRAEIVKSIDDTLVSHDINAPVINQTVKDGNDYKAFAKEHGISYGKAIFVKNIAGKDASLNPEQLAKLSITELAKLVAKNNIDISDIADYDHDDSIWENIADSIEETNEDIFESKPIEDGNKPSDKAEYISKEKIKSIVLEHAKFTDNDSVRVHIEFDVDDGYAVYEVDFNADGYEYEYEVDAKTGKILSADKEIDD